MHRRFDFGLILCAFDLHDPIHVVEPSEFSRRHVTYRRCLRCSRTLRPQYT